MISTNRFFTFTTRTVLMIFVLLAVTCNITPSSAASISSPKVVHFKTKDGWTIVGDLYTPIRKAKGVVILLHQRGGSASDWAPLCVTLQKNGYEALAIDARGTGRSTKGPGPMGINAPWLTTPDIAGAIHYLKTNNAILIGASFGANNALIYASEHQKKLNGIILLSPGKDYNGLTALPAAQLCNVPVSIFVSEHDPIPQNGPVIIARNLPHGDICHLVVLHGNVHGTGLLNSKFDIELLVEVNALESYHKNAKSMRAKM